VKNRYYTASHTKGKFMKVARLLLTFYGLCFSGAVFAVAQQRPPATPLIAHDPYFSVWSTGDHLTDAETTHWTGSGQSISGVARIDGAAYRFMGRLPGRRPDPIPAMEQTASSITPTHTRYEFRQGGVTVELTFFTPAMTSDIDVLSRPVTYLSWSVQATDGKSHPVSLLLDVDPVIAVNDRTQEVLTFRNQTSRLNVLSAGSRDQSLLNRSGDNLRIDWGYFRLAVPKDQDATTVVTPNPKAEFAATGKLAASDSMDMPEAPGRTSPHLAALFDLGSVGAQPVKRHLLVAYTEGFAIQYLERNLRPYWQRRDMAVEALLDLAEQQYSDLDAKGVAFDKELTDDLTRAGGEHYAAISILAFRQTLAAHKIAADLDGTPMMFPKENTSNGCISTVDVIYPSAPFFLFLNPKLLEAQLVPVLQYSTLYRWQFPFAPHDLGTYPLANGQVYGGGEKTEENQMPVEESGNMLILMDALARAEGNAALAEKYWPQLTKWAQYLKDKGVDPENQLTTDDFAGHVAHNANLSIKAIDALAAYADLAHLLKQEAVATDYSSTAKSMAAKWVSMAADGDHYRFGFDAPNTWSQKYNLVWDKILGFNLFPKKVREAEMAYYLTKLNTYGLPLDYRADYTKLDWSVWTATLADDPKQFNALIDPIYKWTNETPDRVPLSDWYDTKTGKHISFMARSVVGGVYIKALAEKQIVAKWNKFSSQ
jgi:Domain of unknown function (DUF4965)/Domain of unknown function (DUF1793)/Domain of unknown function (DUF5127)/Domain of unknown function (DUF4964)